ncbi:hypothetical protein BDY19DRAFT_905246 [Irpex rosettiformis]|uniref:Uncharacterized protein n=1 Tax=Irpex rosettiformis TaxID=378272 RepID=A0ACB8U8A9_9APHY|nr:hypothetical protein BDY19DRAFT_905246 [Irpex rosettiformis]
MAVSQQLDREKSSSSILSSVFTFVHREIESFVATAKGEEPPKVPKASTSRVKLDTAPREKKNSNGVRKRTVSSLREGAQEAAGARQRKKLDNARKAGSSDSGNAAYSPGKLHKRPDTVGMPQRPRPSPQTHRAHTEAPRIDKQITKAADNSVSLHKPSPVPPLRTFSNVVKRKASATMPGSLFPRSASIEPDPTPGPASYGLLRERTKLLAAVSRTPLHSVGFAKERLTTRPPVTQSPGDPNPFLGITNTLARARGVIGSTEDAKRFLEDYNPSSPSSPSPAMPLPVRGPRKSYGPNDDETSAIVAHSKSKGKERARDADFEWDDNSRVLRVRGKEQELREAREEHIRKEQERELDPETTLIMEERYHDKERIRKLEAEVAWLKSQLEEQMSLSRIDVSDLSFPPPPPPPPPPPMSTTRQPVELPVTVARIRNKTSKFSAATTDAFLQKARAALRKQPSPLEAPINPINAPPLPKSNAKVKRTGRPSINVPSEKMDAFLTEVKSAKLKKISGTLAPPLVRENPTAALARELGASGKGKELLRTIERRRSLSEIDVGTGTKRKRDTLEIDALEAAGPPKKRIVKEASNSSSTSTSSTSSSSSTMPSRKQFSFGLQDHSWPSIATTDTELTTPSLCSDDNDHASEVAPEDVLPPTPPTPPCRPPTPPRRLKRHSEESREAESPEDDRLPEIIDVIDVDAESDVFLSPITVTPRVPEKASPKKCASPEDIFAKRPPTSPMPKITTKKPAPPARTRVRSGDSSPRGRTTSATQSPVTRHSKATAPALTNPLSAPVLAKKKKKARRSASTGAIANDTLVIQPIDPTPASPHIQRLRTLDAELRRAGDHLWDENSAEGLEADIFQTRGVKNSRGFLARGGGGGPSVYMGEGYVQGYEKESSRQIRSRSTNGRY